MTAVNIKGQVVSSKYFVMKRSDWDALCNQFGHEGEPVIGAMAEADLEDAEVIRLKDLTAAPILHTYASIIQSFIDINQLSDEDKEALTDIADWAYSAAVRSEAIGPLRRLPN